MTTQRPVLPGGHLLDRRSLTDPTRCPACAAPLPGALCAVCGLDTSGPAGLELWTVSQEVVAVLERRDALVATMRATSQVPAVPVPVPVPVPFFPAPTLPEPVRSSFVAPAYTHPGAPPSDLTGAVGPVMPMGVGLGIRPDARPGGGWIAPQTAVRRSWPLQNVLLALGAVLLGGASVVFLAFAWGAMPVGVRALIVVGLTALFFAVASVTARKELRSSAEALGAVGALLVVLDVWAVRATGLLDLPPGSWYLAVVATVSAAVLVPLGHRLHLVVPRVVGTLLVPCAPALLALSAPSPGARGPLFALGAAVCVIALDARCERRAVPVLRGLAVALVSLSAVSALGALVTTGLLATAGCLAAGALACVLWSWRSSGPAGGPADAPAGASWAMAAGSGVVLSCAALVAGLLHAATASGWDGWPSAHVVWAGPLGATLGALAVVVAVARLPRLGVAAPGAAAVTLAVTAAVPVLPAVALLSVAALSPSGLSGRPVLLVVSTIVGLIVAAGGVVAVRRSRGGRTRAITVAASCCGLAVLTTGLLPGTLVGLAVLWLAAPLALLLTVGRSLDRPWRTTARVTAAVGVALTATVGSVAASGATELARASGELVFAAALGCAAVLLVLARGWTTPEPDGSAPRQVRAALLLGAVILGATSLGTAVQAIVDVRSVGWFVAALAVLLPVAALVVARQVAERQVAAGRRPTAVGREDAADRDGALLLAATLTAVPALVVGSVEPLLTGGSGSSGSSPWWIVAQAAAVAAVALLIAAVAGAGRSWSTRLRTTGAGLVPVLVVLLVLALRPLDGDGRVDWALLCASLVALFPAVAALLPRPPEGPRRAMELSATMLGLVCVLVLVGSGTPQALLVALLVQAAGALAWSLTPGRATVGWLALSLSVAASWVALVDEQVSLPEAYTAPGAVALLLVGLWRVGRRRAGAAGPLLGGVGALLLPTALLAPDGASWRAPALCAATLVIAGIVATTDQTRTADRRTASGIVALALGAATVGVGGRALVAALETADAVVWVAVATSLVLALCGVLGRSWAWPPLRGPRVWAPSLVAAVLTVPLAVLLSAETSAATGGLAVGLVAVWGVAAVLGTPPGLPRIGSRHEFLLRAVPPLVGSGLAALVLAGTSAPADLLLVVAGGFVAYATVRFTQVEHGTSTWRSLAYGVVATVLPVTLALLADPTGWRIALGLALAAGWVIVGVRCAWQAPVALGAAALAVQVVALAGPPALAGLAGVPGWLVLAVVGGVLLLLGLTYERQIRTARASARWYSQLR